MKTEKVDKLAKQKLITTTCRLSYPHLFKAGGMEGSKPKFSMVGLFKKSSDMAPLLKAMKAAKIAKFGPDKSEWPEMESPIADGDEHPERDGYKGCWAVKFASLEDRGAPGKVDVDYEDIINPGDLYPGCYVRVQTLAYIWGYPRKNPTKFGVGLSLDGVQKVKEGKKFGGTRDAKSAFGAVAIESDYDEDGDTEASNDSDDGDEDGGF